MCDVPRPARFIYTFLFIQASLQLFYLRESLKTRESASDGAATSTNGSACPLTHLPELELAEQYELHASFMRRGRKSVLSEEEIQLTFKYWEVTGWVKNFPNSPVPSIPYNFSNLNPWGSPHGVDKILTQIIWRAQLIIGNYIRKQQLATSLGEKYPLHTIDTRPKRIFMGDLVRYWEDWLLLPEWMKTKRLHHCNWDTALPGPLADAEPVCELVDTIPSNWSEIDLIATHQIRGHPLEEEDVPRHIPWFKYSHESPAYFPIQATRHWQFVNSFWSGSPVQQHYAKWVYFNPYRRSRVQRKDYSEGKSKMVAMLVSNCKNVHNDRMGYARELQKHINVSIYGKCGDMECKNLKNETCFEILQGFKFYLAFENSNCREYVTEKLHINAFENDIIPIVMGAPPEFYLQHAPQNSYIHVQDFESPQMLAKYLTVLAKNATMYNSYFQWKGTGQLLYPRWPWLCTVCAQLYSDVPIVDRTQTKFSATHWTPGFKVDGNPFCLPENRWYW